MSKNGPLRLIGFKEYNPAVTFEDTCHVWSLNNCTHPGSDVEFLTMVLDSAGLKYSLVTKDLNSTLILDALTAGEADLSLVALRINPERMTDVSFTLPINYLQFGYYVKQLSTLESDQFVLKTFQSDVYMVLVLTFSVIAAVYWLKYRQMPYLEWFWLSFASFFNQDKKLISDRWSFMTLTASWWFFSFLTICFYQARMKYFLTVPLEKGIDFYTMDQMLSKLEDGRWTGYQLAEGYAPSMYCNKDQCLRIAALERIGKIKTVYDPDQLDTIINSVPYAVTFTAFNYDYAPNDVNIVDREKKILFIRDNTIAVEMLGFALKKNLSTELELINRGIAQFISSYANVRARYTSPMFPYLTDSPKNGAVTLTLLHMNILFYFYFILISLSITAFGVELLHHRYNWKNDGHWMPQNREYNMGPMHQLSAESHVSYQRRRLVDVLHEKVRQLHLQTSRRSSYDVVGSVKKNLNE